MPCEKQRTFGRHIGCAVCFVAMFSSSPPSRRRGAAGTASAESRLFSVRTDQPSVTIVEATRGGQQLPVAGQNAGATFFRIDNPAGQVPCSNRFQFVASNGASVDAPVDLCANNWTLTVSVGATAPVPTATPVAPPPGAAYHRCDRRPAGSHCHRRSGRDHHRRFSSTVSRCPSPTVRTRTSRSCCRAPGRASSARAISVSRCPMAGVSRGRSTSARRISSWSSAWSAACRRPPSRHRFARPAAVRRCRRQPSSRCRRRRLRKPRRSLRWRRRSRWPGCSGCSQRLETTRWSPTVSRAPIPAPFVPSARRGAVRSP